MQNPEKPILSQAGNPFPAKLEPVFVDLDPHGAPGRVWPVPFPAKMPKMDFSEFVTTEEYIYEEFEEGDPWPRFKVRLQPRRPQDTDAFYEDYRRGIESHARDHGVMLGFCQDLCTWLGNFETCSLGACRRRRECCSRRDEDTTDISLAIFPPCVPMDVDMIESYRMEISREISRLEAAGVFDAPDVQSSARAADSWGLP